MLNLDNFLGVFFKLIFLIVSIFKHLNIWWRTSSASAIAKQPKALRLNRGLGTNCWMGKGSFTKTAAIVIYKMSQAVICAWIWKKPIWSSLNLLQDWMQVPTRPKELEMKRSITREVKHYLPQSAQYRRPEKLVKWQVIYKNCFIVDVLNDFNL